MHPPERKIDDVSLSFRCPAKWDAMRGDECVRFCELCQRHVYNIAEMSRADAEALISRKEGRPCLRLYRRADGTVVTSQCPEVLRALRRRMRWIGAGIAAALSCCAAFVLPKSVADSNRDTLVKWFFPPAPHTTQGDRQCEMGW